MAKKKRDDDAHTGGHGWYVSFADLMGLMMSFFVMLVAFSNQDQQKLKIVAGSMREAFGVQTDARHTGIIESRWPADEAEAEKHRARSTRGSIQYADPG
jgi:chemotaxis protein MotB